MRRQPLQRLLLWTLLALCSSLWSCSCGDTSDPIDPCKDCLGAQCVNGTCLQREKKCLPARRGDCVWNHSQDECHNTNHLKVCVDSLDGCVTGEWKIKACPTGEVCSEGKCGPVKTCPKPECTIGDTRCDPKAGTVQVCAKSALQCAVWTDPTTCSPNQACTTGACSDDKCGNVPAPACSPNEVTCDGQDLKTCVDAAGGCTRRWEVTTCKDDELCDTKVSKCVPKPIDTTKDVVAIQKGVKVIGIPGAAGSLTVFGKNAAIIVAGKATDALYEPVAGIAYHGKGRVAALSHGGYLNAEIQAKADTHQFMRNLIDWLAAAKTSPAQVQIGIWQGLSLADELKKSKYNVLASNDLTALLSQAKVAILRSAQLATPEARAAVAAFVRNGGGLLLADTAWGWAQLNPGKSLLTDFPGNLFLQDMGMAWTGSILRATHKDGFDVALPGAPLQRLLHVQPSLDLLVQYTEQQAIASKLELDEASHIVIQSLRHLRDDDKVILPQISDLLHKHPYNPPTAKQPLDSKNALARVLMTYNLLRSWRKKPEDVRPNPAAATFPGSVPTNAKRTSLTLTIDTSIPDWHSTGLYAAPGEVIEIKLAAADIGKKLVVRIGAHKDKLWHKDQWERVPEISRTWPLQTAVTKIASSFGGLLYIEVPRNAQAATVSVTLSNGVLAPRYVHGKTTLAEWRSTLRSLPAPWAELASDTLILTVPSSVVRALDNPDALMQHWDKVLNACADLATLPRTRSRPERVVTDQQISAGYMHAGYPIMTHLDVIKELSDPVHMSTKGGWGIYHELGHNHQHKDWTFAGTGEVTVNLFTLYIFHTIHNNMQPRTNIYGANRQAMIDKYTKAGAQFSTWQGDPFLALLMYMQLQEGFGWEAYKKVFAEYRALPDAQRPTTEAARRDQWMVRFSKAIGKNLGPFFTAWGIPTTAAAKTSINQLPSWMPAGFPPSP